MGTEGMQRKTGLTLGKFAPLHKGHQYMVETALAETDELIILIYDCPETTSIPLQVRAEWLRVLYPMARVIEARGGPTDVGYTPEIKKAQEDYALGLLGGETITHFYSSEPYGEHMSEALGAVNRQVDPARERFPVSGTAVRADPYAYRELVHPLVYRDLIVKAVFMGAPSTGKTTLAHLMAERTGSEWMPEYGREYWETHQVDRRLTPEQLLEIAEGHLERENQLAEIAEGTLFVDTNALTTYRFALEYHGMALPELVRLAEAVATRYDLVFLCDDDIPYDDTWDRSGDVERQRFQQMIIGDLDRLRIPYVTLSGSLEERARRVEEALAAYRKC
ncbi:AAA family ATPase [Cohnella soli]|uniref:AAA family ATPase n=1 Tax=Cohnella soli TaxID=425005 RepID=A0ABW0HSE0_9BACL